MNRTLRIAFFVVVAAGLIAVVILASREKNLKKDSPSVTADSAGLETEIPVVGLVLKPGRFEEVLAVSGIIEAWHRTVVSPEAGGRVVAWSAEIGQYLQEGGVILKIDDEVASLQLNQAEAALESARVAAANADRDLQRQESLHNQGDLSDNLFEAAKLGRQSALAQLKAAEATAGLARRTYNETRVRMPFNGVLSARLVETGQTIAPGTPVAEVVQANPLRMSIGVTAQDIAVVRPGQSVRITSVSGLDRDFSAAVYAVGKASDRVSRLFPVEIRVPNPELVIKPGMSSSAEIIIAVHPRALTVPSEAVFEEGEASFCYVVEGGRAAKRRVGVKAHHSGMAMLETGVAAGDTVVVVGRAALRPGQRLTLTLEDDPFAVQSHPKSD